MTTNPISLIITSDATISAQLEAIGLTVKILVINSVTGNPIPHAKVYVEGGTTTLQTTDTTGVVYWQGFKTEDVNKTFICRVADSGTETYLNYTNSFQLRGLANETWTVPLSNSNNSAKCYLLSEKTLAPVNDATISIHDTDENIIAVPAMVTVDGLAEWQGLILDIGEYCFYYEYLPVPGELPVTAISKPFAANVSAVQIIRYMFINPPLEGITIGEYPLIAGILGYSDGSSDLETEIFGNLNPKKIQMTPSTKATIKAVLLQQDQCNMVIDVGERDSKYENAILTLKMSNFPDMALSFIMFGDSSKDYTTCTFGNNDPNLTEQWWQFWGANIGITLPFKLTSSLNVSALEIHVKTSDDSPIKSARVEISYNGKANVSNTDNKGISVFYGVPTGTEISYIVTAAGYNTKQGSWTINTDVEYDTEYVVLTKTSTTYTIMTGIAIGGTASSNKSTAAEGEQVIFTAIPDVGSEFLNWEIMKDGESTPSMSIDNSLTYTMPACNIGVTPVFNEGGPPVPDDPITLVFKVTGTDGPPSGYTVRFTYPDGSLIFEGTTKALGTVRMNTADYPMAAVDGMIATATKGSYAGTITINVTDVTEDKANLSGEILFEIPVITTGTLGSSNAKDAKTTITIPAGVNVIKFKDVYIGVTPNKTYNIKKQSFALGNEFRLSVSSDAEGYWRETVYTTTVFNELTLSFEYGPEINLVTPTVTDY